MEDGVVRHPAARERREIGVISPLLSNIYLRAAGPGVELETQCASGKLVPVRWTTSWFCAAQRQRLRSL
ncbi:MAG: hypothetical protein IPI51_13680 [Betaproteobacteria bacterium]|nr:hypothetical protein [Betaproteobacteria bacterium]